VSATPEPTLVSRIVSRVGEESIVREGYGRIQRDAYHYLVESSWPRLLLILFGLYLVANAIFACAYLLQPHSIRHARTGSFEDAFFFSVQTMATIGYGMLVPHTRYANVLVVLETSTGILGLAMITGIIFAKFSRPSARIVFSERAIITRRDGMPCLLFRMANARATQIVDAQATVLLARSETTLEGEGVRRFYELELSRQRNPIFSLTWTAIHFINEASPLYGATPESLVSSESEVIVSVVGIDESLSQTVHARYSYLPDEITWGGRFADVISRLPDGRRHVDLSRFHDILDDKASIPPWLTDGEAQT
jgi:inward rectifier potassium channel